MTIALSLKVNDGVVLATDSASTLTIQDNQGNPKDMVYNHANKVFNLRKGLPIGLMTWGLGSIGNSSIERLVKDFRAQISSDDSDWFVGIDSDYQLEDIAGRFRDFIYDEHYIEAYGDSGSKPDIGFMIAGYSADRDMAEEWRLQIEGGDCRGPNQVREIGDCGVSWSGRPHAIHRLYLGYDARLQDLLVQAGLDSDEVDEFLSGAQELLKAPIIWDPMPIQDAIELARFLVDTTINYHRFLPGSDVVGGPIEIAAITKHERFKWIDRKHYFDVDLNPVVDPNAPPRPDRS